jgi:hypothetical protein
MPADLFLKLLLKDPTVQEMGKRILEKSQKKMVSQPLEYGTP